MHICFFTWLLVVIRSVELLKMFGKLNADSWAIILKYVELKDQLSLWEISEDMSINVENHWRTVKEAHFDRNTFRELKELSKMHNFLCITCESLEILSISIDYHDILLSFWKTSSYPKLRSLHCRSSASKNSNRLTLILTQLFPNLTKLHLETYSNGHFLENFTKLEELILHSSEVSTSTLDKIFASLRLRKLFFLPFCTSKVGDVSLIRKCDSLEELLTEIERLKYEMLKNLMKLPRFHRLAIYTRDSCDYYLSNLKDLQQGPRVLSLVFHRSTWFLNNLTHYIISFSNLRRLVIQSDEIDMKCLYLLCVKLQNLEELHLLDINDFLFATEIWNIVGACRSLKLLNISDNELDGSFLDESVECLSRVLKGRNALEPLTLHVHNTILANDREKTIAALYHPFLIVSFHAVRIDSLAKDLDRRFVETEFQLLETAAVV